MTQRLNVGKWWISVGQLIGRDMGEADIVSIASVSYIAEMAVDLVPHDPHWSVAFADEAIALQAVLETTAASIHHIGSTAIPSILAKPIIDILCVVYSLEAVDAANKRMRSLGYVAKGEHGIEARRYFQKSDARGVRSHHLHVFQSGSDHIERHLAFRDFLLAHPARATMYSDLKVAILQNTVPSRQAYQDRKASFVAATQAEAIDWYRQRA